MNGMRGFIQFPALTGQKKDLGLTARHQVNSDSEDEIFSLLPQQRQKKYNAKKLKSRGCDSSSPECKGAVTMLLIILWVSTVALIVLTAFGEFNIENDNGTSSEKPAERLKHDNMVLEYFDSYMNQALKIARSNNNSISNNNNAIGYRLPRNVIPINYYLKISPNLEQFKYSGYVLITTKIESNTNFVVLHSKNHVIDKAMLVRHDRTIEHMNVTKDTKRDFLILASSRQLKKETPYHIKINFHGKIKGELTGFYSDSYINGKGKRKYLASTLFESAHARETFPCFDEPALKATFQLVITHDKKHIAVSNMPTKRKVKNNDLIEHHFQKSPKMSTYLLAFGVFPYTHVKSKTKRNLLVRVFTNKEQINMADYTRRWAPKFIDYFEKLFKVKYPLPKLDIVAVPQFESGAEENWGLIIGRQTTFLCDENKSTPAEKEFTTGALAHEISHQWFGDLVTMQWWSDLWLKEGFADYIERVAVNHFYPQWNKLTSFYIEKTRRALDLDELSTSHPIHVAVKNPTDFSSIYDDITYSKGASVIRMLVNFMGGKNFYKGLQKYFQKYQYGNANTSNLWHELSKEFKSVDVQQVMDTWVLQQGYPVVTISHDEENSLAIAKQDRFMILKKPLPKSPYGYKWKIPLRHITQRSPHPTQTWMKSSSVTFPWLSKSGWLKANLGQTGVYRVNYDEKNWKALIKQLHQNHKILPEVDRAGLIDDSFHLARAGLLNFNIALDLTEYLGKERSYVPWMTALANFDYLQTMLQSKQILSCLKEYILQLLGPMNKALGWKQTGSLLERKLRQSSLIKAVGLEDRQSIFEAKDLFRKWKISSGRYSIPITLRYTAYFAGIKYGLTKDWEFVWKKYKAEKITSERERLLNALGKTRNLKLLKRYLSYALDLKVIKISDAPIVLTATGLNPVGHEITWEFIKKHWGTLNKRYGNNVDQMQTPLASILGRFTTNEKLNEVKTFFKNRPLGSNVRSIMQGTERIEQNIDFLSKYEGKISNWLKSRKNLLCTVKN